MQGNFKDILFGHLNDLLGTYKDYWPFAPILCLAIFSSGNDHTVHKDVVCIHWWMWKEKDAYNLKASLAHNYGYNLQQLFLSNEKTSFSLYLYPLRCGEGGVPSFQPKLSLN